MSESPDSLFRRISEGAADSLPPVHLWHPREVKDIGLKVTRDGTWWHQGSPIRRPRMVRMFSRVLRREEDEYFLVTPVEKVRLEVEAAPLLAVRMEVRRTGAGTEIAFETNTGELVVADGGHPVRVLGTPDAPMPVVVVRDGIEALLTRSVFLELVDQGEVTGTNPKTLVVRSRGASFPLGVL